MRRSNAHYHSPQHMNESIEASRGVGRMQLSDSRRFNQNPMPVASSSEQYMMPQHRLPNQVSAQHHNPMPVDRSSEQYMMPQHRHPNQVSAQHHNPMPVDRSSEQYMMPQHRFPNRVSAQHRLPNQVSAQHHNPMPVDSRSEQYMMPRRRLLNQVSAQHQPYPNNENLIQPAVSGTVPQPAVSLRQQVIDGLPSRNMGGALLYGDRTAHISPLHHAGNHQFEDHRVTEIVRQMEQDFRLMEDTPESENLRRDAVREVPESLTLKRTIKRNLVQSVNQKSKHTPLSTWKILKYRLSLFLQKFNAAVRNLLYMFELWYSSLKTIEGRFGSGVASYFKFLRWLFLLNTAVFLISFGFIVVPQLLHPLSEPVEEVHTSDNTTNDAVFSFGDIFTGEGSFNDTILYYGYYTNESVSLVAGVTYHIPPAYFFTVLACYLLSFVVLSVSMARSYRRTFIETSGNIKDIFCQKVFCGWDFSIATPSAATLKMNSIFNELQELLGDMRANRKLTSQQSCCIFTLRVGLNVFVGLLLASFGLLVWFLLDSEVGDSKTNMIVPITITLIMMVVPVLFSWLTRMEDYANPRTALFVTLTKTFLMEAVMIFIVALFWVTRNSEEFTCWETSLGQEVYRLVIIDFLFTIVGTSLAEFVRFQIYKRIWEKIGVPEFNIAQNTLHIIYNQTLFFVGLYFSPLLALLVTLKMFITFYIRKFGLLNSCQPTTKPWRAAQTQTLFLAMSFVVTLAVLTLLAVIITQVNSSNCGPFRHYAYPYEVILDVFQVKDDSNGFLQFLRFITRPGVIGGILLVMCVVVYFLRAKALTHESMVHHLREMLVWEAKDKEFLLSSISSNPENSINISAAHDGLSEYDRQRFHTRVHEHRL